jgi:hypothetical protein
MTQSVAVAANPLPEHAAGTLPLGWSVHQPAQGRCDPTPGFEIVVFASSDAAQNEQIGLISPPRRIDGRCHACHPSSFADRPKAQQKGRSESPRP